MTRMPPELKPRMDGHDGGASTAGKDVNVKIWGVVVALALSVAVLQAAEARGSHSYGRFSSHVSHSHRFSPEFTIRTVHTKAHDDNLHLYPTSRIHRSAAAKREFLRSQGYTKQPKGMIVDHIVPLCAGGPDAPSNMQLQTVAAAKAKDVSERAQCSKHGRR